MSYGSIIVFYLIVISIFLLKKKHVARQGIVFLLRSSVGVSVIKRFAKRYRPWVILTGYIAAGAGFIGMVLISLMLIYQAISLFISPDTAQGLTMVYPGLSIPGIGVLSFAYFIITLFIIVLVHEFGHGIVAEAHNIPVKKTGLLLFGPIIGAFVEPDEKKLFKKSDIQQYSVLGNGAFFNFVLAVIALLVMNVVLNPVIGTMTQPAGISFSEYYEEDYPAQRAGIKTGEIITAVNGEDVNTYPDFMSQAACWSPSQNIVISTQNNSYSLTTTNAPDNPEKGFIGIKGMIQTHTVIRENYKKVEWLYSIIEWVNGLFRWMFVLSLGIGLFNLLPLPITDGGRMLLVFFQTLNKDKADKRFSRVSMFFILVVLMLIGRWVFSLVF